MKLDSDELKARQEDPSALRAENESLKAEVVLLQRRIECLSAGNGMRPSHHLRFVSRSLCAQLMLVVSRPMHAWGLQLARGFMHD